MSALGRLESQLSRIPWAGLSGIAAGVGAIALLSRGRSFGYRGAVRYAPGSADQIRLFTVAARRAGLPVQWASSSALIELLRRESDGWVGRPNYSYGQRSTDRALWPSVWTELQAGIKSTASSATGLGQLILPNVDRYYPHGRASIGIALDEAVGMLRYIADRHGTPERALAQYGEGGY